MELRQLEHFVMVADERHFTRAAVKVHLAQSSLSSSIAALERELGAELLIRSSRKVDLTEAGHALLPEARRALSAARAGQEAVTAVRGVLRGRLRVGTIAALGGVPVTKWLADFHAQHPAVQLRMHHNSVPALVRGVMSGDLDMAIVDRPYDARQLHEHLLAVEALVVVVNSDDPLAGQTGIALGDLAGRLFADYRSDSALRARIDDACESAGVRRQTIFEADTISDLLSAVEHGIGIAIVPPETTAGRPGLHSVAITPAIKRELVLVHAANRPPSPASRQFLREIGYSHATSERIAAAPRHKNNRNQHDRELI